MSSPALALQIGRPAYYEIANLELTRILEGLPRGLAVLDAARTRIDAAYVGDVTRPEAYPFHGQAQFDLIVLSDILEHVSDPQDVIARNTALLRPGGRILISIPNHETGTMDKTHLRFFTQRRAAGLRILKQRVRSANSSSIMQSRPYRFYTQWLYPVEAALCRLCPGVPASVPGGGRR